MSSGLEQRLRRLCNELFFLYTMCLGMNSYRYDHLANTFKQTRRMRFTALLANILTLLVLPHFAWYTWHQVKTIQDTVYDHPLVHLGNFAYVAIRSSIVFYTVLVRYSRDKAICAIVFEFQEMHSHLFESMPLNADIESKCNRLLYIKYACSGLFSLYEVYTQFSLMVESTWNGLVHSVLAINMGLILYITTLNYFRNMWYAYRNLCYTNDQLCIRLHHLLSEPAPTSCVRPSRNHQYEQLRRLMMVHWKCASIVRRLNEMYRFQMLCMRFNFFIMNVYMGYWLCISTVGDLISPLTTVLDFCIFAVSATDLYMIDMICDKTICTYNETIRILRVCNSFGNRCSELEVLCERFALRLAADKLRLSQYGLFEVDKRLLLKMYAAVVSYTLVIVQYHIVLTKLLCSLPKQNTEK